ncbi:FxsB family radical SAM/SPASM domain protein [Microbispora cellulosiformans]|uniref:FxsB family radical SAM/SPASM domain protein n=1 Tax=Microbispora cellulosiformans TaxID=2614688 RepID=A0A5J5KAI8_9ACTN|nr:FxsB family cyclophane-forming radical SAM/SPASM peptide maturase [Microbispora cellulosiformans]KAA9380572.1 FxsB family radical SAM/SPASM domain protein [Microbispora cellulosiformans]
MQPPIAPFRQFVVKVASRCDLACDHCYVYEHADTSWRGRPVVMSDETAIRVANRIAEHADEHRLEAVHVVFHGGEPLLAGVDRLRRFARALRRAAEGVCALDLHIHTNGVMLSRAFCDMFTEENIRVGVSIDGDRAANDLHRLYANGRSSYDQVIRAISLLRDDYPHLYAGLLCTVDVRNDPVAVYEALVALRPPRVDFLLPHATWDHPPLRPAGRDTAYADWLITVHDRWRADGRPMQVRMFDSIILTALGGESQSESLGTRPSDLVVVETDGTYEQADSLKTAYDGAPETGLDAARHSLSEAARHPGFAARQSGLASLAGECRRCPLVRDCGGGLYAHRHRTGSGFANPSVYCADLFTLISHLTAAEQRTSAAPVHELPVATLDALASGSPSSADIAHLSAPQLSRARQAVRRAAAVIADRRSWSILVDAERASRAAVDDLLSHPYVRAWAVRCVATGPVLTAADAGHLAAVAVVAAVRTGLAVKVAVPAVGNLVHLPGLGRMRTGGQEHAEVEVHDRSFAVRVDGRWLSEDSPLWEPVRPIEVAGLRLLLDDVDPYRDCYGPPVGDRLTDEAAAAWSEVAGAALASLPADQRAAMRACLRVLTPLADTTAGASSRAAYGALALPPVTDPGTAARLLVEHFHRAQIGALLDLLDLTGGDADRERLLTDAYGLLAVADSLTQAEQDRLASAIGRIADGALPAPGRRFAVRLADAAADRNARAATAGRR